MDVRVIVLVGTPADGENVFKTSAETVAGVPIAVFDVLGKPVFQRVLEQVSRWGVAATTLVTELSPAAADLFEKPAGVRHLTAGSGQLWRVAENAFGEHAQAGADAVLVLRVGPYIELNADELVQFHVDQRNRVTPVVDAAGEPLPIFVLSASRRNDAAFLFRHAMQQMRVSGASYSYKGYCNRLVDAADLRRLAVDGLLGHAGLDPVGHELKPGVWVGEGARIQRGARLLAPAFIGRRAKVRAAAVVTRCSAIEHHSEVDCGTVIENSTVLPYSYVGAGLDANHTVLGLKHLSHLKRSVEIEISDPKLLGMRSTSAPVRTLASAIALTSFLPVQLLRGLFSSSKASEPTPCLPASLNAPEPELKPEIAGPDQDFSADLVVARRYGDQ
ncbi:MAG TPA: hypothetical protein VE825_16860 [Terriglobales bacterium]|nr:hypothetical protein [Terriglobales bacterium]